MAAAFSGQVRVTPGTELPKPVLINLESRGSVVNTVYTDGEGRFGFNGLLGNIYHIRIDDDTYLPANETVMIDGKTKPVAMVSILLHPRTRKSQIPVRSREAIPI